MFYTMQDFMSHAKGWSYFVAGLILVGFVFFWLYLTGRERK